ncbi:MULTISPECIES: cytochrome c/FTR1 family iron permease [unclassified Bradyrhizobium]|uniref:cytochrome c/FTR1 family iron permease n=1 Tax=unclassified Bradyrhizobium TaxID=2631580 RepID=UPI0024786080|nr:MULTISPECIES: cytochrome c/FTR1 family iron permease [unclassified Bradyrhizobium]WGS21077.1 cytochrome c/FTR1 family iron permease [Bradyrhizobium sp. ISRA463]WGS27994.1 cytochrome c/FTR1 family iron permease [Bradyrhizobium sp. ISRA464]
MLLALAFFGAARAETSDVETTWRLLDYIAVDYAGAVSHGAVLSPSEYAEQNEFAATVTAKLAALPPKPERQALATEAARLQRAIADKADAEQVAGMAHGLGAALLAAYPVPLAPNKVPDFARGATLFSQNCASCHGEAGDGHGPDAVKLDTPPIAFTDAERARQRSVFALYQVITQGLDGTAMPSFDGLPSDDRWALALYAGHFAFPDPAAAEGERLWKQDTSLHRLIPDLKALVGTTPAALASKIGPDKADALMAYLRRHPDAVMQQQARALSLVRGRLAESLAAYRAGDRQHAAELALSAYLDGFEPVEPTLSARDRTLMERIEGAMGDYRAAIQSGENADALANRVQVLDDLFDDAEASLSPDAASSLSTFLGAAAILLREGLEALLIVVAMIAFLRKAERMEVMPYVHAGWVGALVAGLLTWVVATWVVGISGASRELTEGFGSVFAAVVLLSVGIWMHGKAQADQWQRYIREKMAKALSGSSAWLLFGLAFIVVYREVFETILFYAALWAQGSGSMILAGALSACAALAVIAWAMLRYSRRLPIGKFFTYSSWLMAVLTVVLAGKGIAALQEAGIVSIVPLRSVPRISLVGLFPTTQTVAAQVLMIAALAIGFALNRRKVA